MADLIDRDELMRKHTKSPNHDNSHNTVEELKCLLDLINNAPTIDAVPVVHGHWTECIDPYDGYHGFRCSVCERVNWEFLKYPFCPRCGAKMTNL